MIITRNIEENDELLRNTLLAFLYKVPLLTEDEVEKLADEIKVFFFKKGSVLVEEGEICNKCFFVLKGCLRQHLLVNGNDKTTQFYTEEEAAVFFTSLSSSTKSSSYLSCVEDSILIVGEPAADDETFKKFPKLEQITRMMVEQDFGKTQDELSWFIASSPEERYLNLIKSRPTLLQRVPQHQLASYVGVTPESLSRIRKRILRS